MAEDFDKTRIDRYSKVISSIEAKVSPARLMAVSKTRTIEEIMDAYAAGARLFGENHVQEIVEKFSVDGKPRRPADLELHMIGHLQGNKVNKVVPLVDMIESIDSFQLLQRVDRAAQRCGKVIDVLLELNASGESAKSGFATEGELLECLGLSKDLHNVRIRGLMTVGPVSCSPDDKDRLTDIAFRQLHDLFMSIKNGGLYPYASMDVLSMGMSGDYMIGVAQGSTEVRIGTAIFGARDYSKDYSKDSPKDCSEVAVERSGKNADGDSIGRLDDEAGVGV